MGVASLVIGIVAVVFSFIPCINWFAFLPAVVGIVLGAIARNNAKKENKPTGQATAGLVLNIIACAWIPIYVLMIGAAIAAA